MYTQVWTKYLPIIKILLKRTASNDQVLDMNVTDFERAGIARKVGHKFNIHFVNGRVDNVIGTSVLAKDLASVLLQDAMVKDLFMNNEYRINMNPKFQLSIKRVASEAVSQDETIHVEHAVEELKEA